MRLTAILALAIALLAFLCIASVDYTNRVPNLDVATNATVRAVISVGSTNQWKFLGLTVDGGVTNAHFNVNGTNYHAVFIED